jgi:transcriptional antiterminator RfaH
MIHASIIPRDERWYAVQTKPRQEERAEANLLTLGIETFLPRTHSTRPRVRVRLTRPRIEPLFPRYLFVRCDVTSMAHRIRNTRGVNKMLGTDEGPAPVDDDILTTLRGRMDDDGFIVIRPSFHAGDAVRISTGPLRDFIGVFDERLRPLERVAILLKTLNGHVRVILDQNVLQPL